MRNPDSLRFIIHNSSFIILLFLFLPACTKPSYPKENITNAIVDLVRRENNLESEARLAGTTLYLKVDLPDLVSTKNDIQKVVLKKLANVNLAITRVSLSTDAQIEYLVMIVELPGWKTSFSITQRMEDLKGFLYQRISRGDYEDRIIYDLRYDAVLPSLLETQPELTLQEFVARLIASKFNWTTTSNPFLNAALGLRMDIEAVNEDNIILKLNRNEITPLALSFMERTIAEWAETIVVKYKYFALKEVRILDAGGKSLLTIAVNPSADVKSPVPPPAIVHPSAE